MSEEKIQTCDHFKAGLQLQPDGTYKCKGCGAILAFQQQQTSQKPQFIQASRNINDILEDILKELKKINYFARRLASSTSQTYQKKYYR